MSRLLPYETILKAREGDPEAVNAVLLHYAGYIRYFSKVNGQVNAEKFMGIVRKHLAFEELTPTLLREMIEKIVVHECSYDENGTRRQDIEIYYSFVGKIDLPE